jgi:uncharacterized protein YndB with AHSA1/START domain
MAKASTIKTTFSRETSVSAEIKADSKTIWNLLTNSANYPKWNTTVIGIEGNIKPGETIKLKSKLDPKRTFKLKVKEFEAGKKLVWGDAMGNRTYTLSNGGNGSVNFSMTEKIGGIMFPLFAKYIPPFDESFDQFANDLKKEAETLTNTK